tara:strand:- start:96 stop:452 length:357 start_codon:yes stop_codon:yes gene_type:complete
MKKLTLSVGLLIGVLSANAQDTLCTYFDGKQVIDFNYHTSKILLMSEQKTKYWDISVQYGDVMCLHFSDDKTRTRKVITTFFDGTYQEDVLDSKDNIYYSPRGTVKIQVGKPKIFQKL